MLAPRGVRGRGGPARRNPRPRLRARARLPRRRRRPPGGRDRRDPRSEPAAAAPAAQTTRPAFVSAFYLPQFHPTRENDAWWGKGYTEWTAVTRARPAFAGHVQPFLPADLGFYDLRVPETMGEQWRLAARRRHRRLLRLSLLVRRRAGGGRRILEKPLDGLLARPDIPFRYYLCWANEAWRRNWDGLSGEILLDQTYGEGFEAALVASTLPHFADPRYARPDGPAPALRRLSPDRPARPGRLGRADARRLGRGRPPGGRARRRALPRRGRERGRARPLRLLGRDAAARPRRPEGLSRRRPERDAARARRRRATSRG